jgi:2-polyprenyl-3-methyl-5-hydroxy-6-metoxy-1,4-benzoquinol methylase
MSLNVAVRHYWEKQPCGTSDFIVGRTPARSRDWFANVEQHRYQEEPHIFTAAQFTRWAGKELLEIGVGAGCDHLQFARAGAICHGVDLTDAAIETTRQHLALHGHTSDLRRGDAEDLPFAATNFDLVYSWGVIHHSAHPERIIAEIHRVLRPGGSFVGMMYSRLSLVAVKLWVRRALLAGRPLRSLADVVWHHMESVGTKAYTAGELREMFGAFERAQITPVATAYDRKWLGPLARLVPDALGWNFMISAVKR